MLDFKKVLEAMAQTRRSALADSLDPIQWNADEDISTGFRTRKFPPNLVADPAVEADSALGLPICIDHKEAGLSLQCRKGAEIVSLKVPL